MERKNTGLEKAREASKKYGCDVVYPTFKLEHEAKKPTDFSDLHLLEGIEEVKNQLQAEKRKNVKLYVLSILPTSWGWKLRHVK